MHININDRNLFNIVFFTKNRQKKVQLIKKVQLGNEIIQSVILKKGVPLFIGWQLTNRCNQKCKYCNITNIKRDELTTGKILKIINELKKAGTQVITFTGGEPLLRKDIGDIVKACIENNLIVRINSNGALVNKKINEIRGISTLMLSLDGPEKINDLQRQKDSYKKTIQAAKLAKERGIELSFTCTLTKWNLKSTEFVIKKSEELGARVFFQPITKKYFIDEKDVKPLLPNIDEYKKVIKNLVALKKKKRKVIGNSISGLNHIMNYPTGKKTKCVGARIYGRITSDGKLYSCPSFIDLSEGLKNLEKDFLKKFRSLNPPSCEECWVATSVESSKIYSLNINAIYNQL